MSSITLARAGQISDPQECGPGTRITTTGSGYVEWTTGTLVDVRNNVATWQRWPGGTAGDFCDTLRRLVFRGVATGANFVVSWEENQGDPGPEGVYWQEQAFSAALVDPRDFGAKFDGSTDDTVAIQAAITAAGTGVVSLPAGSVAKVRNLTLGNYSKIEGNGARLELLGDSGAIITAPSQGSLQVTDQSWIKHLELDGVNTGAGTIGLSIGNHASIVIESVNIDRCDVGLQVVSGQFNNARSCRIRACNVGMYVKSVAPNGGGNSWSFYDFILDQNKVGALFNGDAAYPFHSVFMRNCTAHNNACAGVAAFNMQELILDGGAPEYTGTTNQLATYTHDSVTAKQASVYLSASFCEVTNFYVAEATVASAFLCENGSRLVVRGLGGYGKTDGQIIDCDSTSFATISGGYHGDGAANGIMAFDGVLLGTQHALVSSFAPMPVADFPNIASTSQSFAFDGVEGTAATTTGTDSVYGNFQQVTFSTSAGNENSHRVRKSFTTVSTFLAVSFQVQSSIDEILSIRFNTGGSGTPRSLRLRAGVWHRVFWMSNALPSGAGGSLIMFPASAGGAVMKFCKWNVITGALTPQIRSYASQMAGGVWKST